MSSWVLGTFEQKDKIAYYEWNKCNGYLVYVGEKNNSTYTTIFRKAYANKEQAEKSFKRVVNRIKNED